MSVYVTSQSTVESEQGSLDNARIGWQTYARDASVVASSAAADHPADAAQRPNTFETWRPTALPATWRADLGQVRSVNYLGIAAHDLSTQGCTVRAQYSADDSTWSNASAVQSLAASPLNNSAVLLLFPAQSARYWRLLVDGAASPSVGLPSLGSIYVGAILTMQRPIYGGHTPLALSRETVLVQTLSRGGQFLGQGVQRSGFMTSVAFKHLTAAWVRSTLDPFVLAARQYPYFFAWRPSDFPEDVGYVWTDKDIRPSNMGVRDFMQANWSMRGHASD